MTDAAYGAVAEIKDLVSVQDVLALLSGTRPVVLLEVHNSLLDEGGDQAYRTGHIPGAVFTDVGRDFLDPTLQGRGVCPLPAIPVFQETVRRWGIDRDTIVVVYDRARRSSAARAWWTLKWAGVPNVAVLDGGFEAWVTAGGKLSTDDSGAVRTGSIRLSGNQLPSIDVEDVLARARNGVLIDARPAEKFSATAHIPGAISSPYNTGLDKDGKLLREAELRKRYAGIELDGSKPVIVYCGGGVSAAHEVFALRQIGIHATLYPGSWSEWSHGGQRPVEEFQSEATV